MPCALRPLDEVGDDEEVAGIFHAFDDLELEGQSLAVFLDGAAGREPVASSIRRSSPASARLRNSAASSTAAPPSPTEKRGRIGCLHPRPEGATLRDLDRRGDRLGQIGEQRGHFGAGLEPVLGRELAPVGLDHQPPFGDADQRVMRLVVLALGEQRLVGRDQRDAARIGELDERRLGGAFGRSAVALQLDVEPVAEQPRQRLAAPARQTALAGDDRRIERPAGPSGQRDQAIGLALEPSELEMRLLVRRRLEKCARIEPHQAAVAALARGQENDARALQDRAVAGARAGLLVGEIHRQCAADDRLDARRRHLVGEFERPEHVVGVGERERGLPVGLGELGKPRDGQRAFEQRIGRVHVQMHETGPIRSSRFSAWRESCGPMRTLSTARRAGDDRMRLIPRLLALVPAS